jgi:uncharacterized protein
MKTQRYLHHDIIDLCFDADKMAFISGARQVGKTTLAKTMLTHRKIGHYYNWDEITFRRLWTKNPALVIPKTIGKSKPLVILDEIHKAKLWKRQIKGLYDALQTPCDLLITGSARLSVYRKGSDSLMGRYHHFRLHPFSQAELLNNKKTLLPDVLIQGLQQETLISLKSDKENFEQLLLFGPFPEPLFSASKRQLNLWQRGRVEKIIREDLRDLSHLPELSQIEMLVSLLPERVANPLSITALSEDLEVAYTTVKRWLQYLSELYYFFELKPYSKSLPRSIKKEGKLYLWDWSEVNDKGARFENLIASHFLKYCDYLTDAGYGKYELRYIRNKQKQEIDFVILQNNKPWLAIEAKVSDDTLSKNWQLFMPYLSCELGIQITQQANVCKMVKAKGYTVLIISADRVLKYFL